MEARLRVLVEIEFPTESIGGVNQAIQQIEHWAAEAGGVALRHPQTAFGDILELGFGLEASTRPPVLLLGHLDTVWPLGTLVTCPGAKRTAASTDPAFST